MRHPYLCDQKNETSESRQERTRYKVRGKQVRKQYTKGTVPLLFKIFDSWRVNRINNMHNKQ